MKIYEKVKFWFFKKVLEESKLFKWANGHKTQISRWLQFVSALSVLVAKFWPEHSYVTEIDSVVIFVLSTLGVEIGKTHKEFKAKEE